ncbi:MAG: response regulator, partial [Candidatus Latescibacteria bacterium]|nr:response regulator [Candidatus Latescibacterota bacterium]
LKELAAAGVDFSLCVVNIIDEEAGTRTQYGATEAGWAGEATMPLSEVSEDFLAIWREGETVVRQVDDHLAERVAGTQERTGVAGRPVAPTALVDVPFDYGTLSLSTRRPEGFREDDVAMVEEMARVLALGYARFLDLQSREAQRQQLAKDAALERIRAEVASMEKADDIGRVMGMVFREIRELGVAATSAVIMVVEEKERHIREYCMIPQEVYAEGVEGTPTVVGIVEGVDLYRGDRAFTGDDDWAVGVWRNQTNNYSQGGGPQSEEQAREEQRRHRAQFGFTVPLAALSSKAASIRVPFTHGLLLFNNHDEPERLSEEDFPIAEDFARMVSLGYARFLDFQRLESQNRALEEANEEIQQANRMKSQFLANMSHELRTPMNSIIGFTRLVLRRGADALSARHRKNLEVVKLSADHLLYLINEILDLSKIEAGRLEVAARRFDVKTLIQSCCETVGPTLGKPGVELHDDVPDDIGEAHTDDSRLRQIVINLLSNAMKFTDEGEVRIVATREGDHLAVAVSDTGPGIPKDKLDTIFEAFQQIDGSTTRRHGGTGLGLSITKSLAELLGGTVEVESRVGEGSTFTVRIPVTFGAPAARPEAGSEDFSSRVPGDERTVVVIDDDPNVAFLLREELAEEGYRVVSAGSADEGVAMVKRLRPVAVTVDIIMPGKDGWETIRMLKGDPETRDVPIVVVSVSDNKELGYQLGVYDYLMKPADSEAILSVLKRLEADGTGDVLVVDDDPNAVNMMAQLLEAEGLSARTASNGQEALDEIAKARPDAVFLDLLMPVMDGFGVIERLQQDEELRRIPVIVVTAKDLTAEEKAYLQEHSSQVVEKGKLEPDTLVKELRQTLNGFASDRN